MHTLLAAFNSDILLQIGGNLAVVLPFMLLAALIGRRSPSVGWSVLAFVFLALNTLLVFVPLHKLIPGWHWHLHYNWLGKLLSLAFTVAFIALIPRVDFKSCGFTWKQKGGLLPVILCGVLICAIEWGASYFYAVSHGGFHFVRPGVEALLYEATIPGLHEEPAYRGVALLLFDRAFRDKRWMLFGAPIGWGAVMTTVFFGVGHGFGFDHGHMIVDWLTIAITGSIGFLLCWVRARTGSLVMPVVLHNLVNVVNQFLG